MIGGSSSFSTLWPGTGTVQIARPLRTSSSRIRPQLFQLCVPKRTLIVGVDGSTVEGVVDSPVLMPELLEDPPSNEPNQLPLLAGVAGLCGIFATEDFSKSFLTALMSIRTHRSYASSVSRFSLQTGGSASGEMDWEGTPWAASSCGW